MGARKFSASESPRARATHLPVRFGGYTVVRSLGKGGMATVVVARPPVGDSLPDPVALKFLHRNLLSDEDAVDSFLMEAELGMRLHHEALCRTYRIETVGERTAIVMEYLDGPPLAHLFRRLHEVPAILNHRAAAVIIGDVARGLHELHHLQASGGGSLSAVHRDVSPQNIVITGAGQAKILDFGVAFSRERRVKTKRGFIKGKLAYLPPEYLLGRVWDHRVDVWSLGVVLWEFLAGRRLFHPGDTPRLMREILKEPIRPPGYYNPHVPVELDDLAMAALERDPARRIGTIIEMAGVTQRYLSQFDTDPNEHVSTWMALAGAAPPASGTVARIAHESVTQPDLFTPEAEPFGPRSRAGAGSWGGGCE